MTSLRNKTVVQWTGRGSYTLIPGGEYDEQEYPAEARREPSWSMRGTYCTTPREVAEVYHLRNWEVMNWNDLK